MGRRGPEPDHAKREAFARLISEGQKSGVVNPELNPPLAALAIVEMLNSVSRWYDPEGPASIEHIIDQYLEILLNGIRLAGSD